MLTLIAHAGADQGAHHYVYILAAAAVGFIAGRVSIRSAVPSAVTVEGQHRG
jgi:hypothetical protein